jgi:hypothetical protein
MTKMKIQSRESAQLLSIVQRFERAAGGMLGPDRIQVLMDLEACHENIVPLDLDRMLDPSTRDQDVVHDVAGISRHINREALTLEDHFLPRLAKRSAAA